MSLKDNHFVSMKALKEIPPLTEEEILEERRKEYLKEIKLGIIHSWMHREKFYQIKVDGRLYHPRTLCDELEELGFFPEHIWQCGSINVYFEPKNSK